MTMPMIAEMIILGAVFLFIATPIVIFIGQILFIIFHLTWFVIWASFYIISCLYRIANSLITWLGLKPSNTNEDRDYDELFEQLLFKVRKLEEQRLQNGYHPGWIYHQCKHDSLLLKALKYLRSTGEIPYPDDRYEDSFEQSKDESFDDSSASSENKSQSSKRSEKRTPFNPYEILGIKPSVGLKEIKAAYRAQMKKYHPDRVNDLGEELRSLAHRKTLEIQKAFEMLNV